MRRLLLAMALSPILLAGCHRPVPQAATRPHQIRPLPKTAAERTAWRKAETDDIYEAVVRASLPAYGQFMLSDWKKELPDCLFFLSINEKDPSDQFLRRFAQEKPKVMKASAWARQVQGAPADHWRFFGQVGSLSFGPLQWQSDTQVKVDFGARGGPRSAAWWHSEVARQGDHWVVTKVIIDGVT